jgi:hypothetical protein
VTHDTAKTSTAKPLTSISDRTPKINDECGKMTVSGKLFMWAMYMDKRKKKMHAGTMDRGYTVLEITFITTLHHVKR